MNRAEITSCVHEFSRLGGKPFKEENPHTLVKKFIMFRNFRDDWETLFRTAFPQDNRIDKQIDALHAVHRSTIPKLGDVQWFCLLNALAYQHGVEPETTKITVHKRARSASLPHYIEFTTAMEAISSTLRPHRDTLFLLQMADSTCANNILYENPVMAKLGVKVQTMQQLIMPKLVEGRARDRAEQIQELSAILSYARVDTAAILDITSLEKIGVVKRAQNNIEPLVTTRKTVYIERLNKLLAERDHLWDTLDDKKLAANYKDGIKDKLAWNLADPSALRKAQLAEACEAMDYAVKILGDVQMDHSAKHRQLLSKVDKLRDERIGLIKSASHSRLYADGKTEVIEWVVPSTRQMNYNAAEATLTKLEMHIDQLKNNQLVVTH